MRCRQTSAAFLRGRQPQTTFIQNLPGVRRRFRAWLPLMPLAMEQLRLSDYDLVISSSHAFAKGVLTGPDQLHVSLRALADALGLGPAAPVPRRIGAHLRAEGPARGPAGAPDAALPAQLGPAQRQWRGLLRRQLALHRTPHPQDLPARGRGDPSTGRHRALRTAPRQGGLLPQCVAARAVQARAAHRRGVRGDARASPGRDRRRPRSRSRAARAAAQRALARPPEHRAADRLDAACARVRLRRRGGLRHRAGRGAGVRHAGDRLRPRRRARDGSR